MKAVARTRRFSYDSEWESNTALSARFESALFFYCQRIYSYAIADGNVLSEAGWMICRLSVVLCIVSNLAVSIVHQRFD